MSEEKKDKRTLVEQEAEMIKVTGEYLIAIDPYNYIARRKGIHKPLGYFRNMQNALSCIFEDMVKRNLQNEARNVQGAIEVINDTVAEFQKIIKVGFPEYEIIKR